MARHAIYIPFDIFDIDDCTEAIGVEQDTDEFSYPIEVCDMNKTGYCEYSVVDHFMRCIHCGRKSEL